MKTLAEIAYFSDDVEGMTAYYRAFLGREPVVASDSMAIFMAGATKIFIHRNYDAADGELPPENHTAFAVANVDAACQALVEAGISVEVPPEDYYWGRSAYLRDPDGHLLEITEESAN